MTLNLISVIAGVASLFLTVFLEWDRITARFSKYTRQRNNVKTPSEEITTIVSNVTIAKTVVGLFVGFSGMFLIVAMLVFGVFKYSEPFNNTKCDLLLFSSMGAGLLWGWTSLRKKTWLKLGLVIFVMLLISGTVTYVFEISW